MSRFTAAKVESHKYIGLVMCHSPPRDSLDVCVHCMFEIVHTHVDVVLSIVIS